MAGSDETIFGDIYLNEMKGSRKGPAVLKTRLVTLRSELPDVLIFAFEGIDDKAIYFQWIGRVRQDLRYEPFPCDGKGNVLDLVDLIDRDRNDIGKGVLFFLDRDFDDLRGRSPRSSIYVTEHYSTENYFVNEATLEELLKDEFHCHADPKRRAELIRLFQGSYSSYLQATKQINRRLYFARRLGIEPKALPKQVAKLATVTLETSTAGPLAPEAIVELSREFSPEETAALEQEFDQLDPRTRYRGKFAYMFFIRWLTLLADDRASDAPKHFDKVKDGAKVQMQRIGHGLLASKSQPPPELITFLSSVTF